MGVVAVGRDSYTASWGQHLAPLVPWEQTVSVLLRRGLCLNILPVQD